MKDNIFHLKFSTFYVFFNGNSKTKLSKSRKIMTYIMYPFAWMFFLTLILTLVIFVGGLLTKARERRKYPSEKYRKVVKEGILWDSVEYHER